MSAYVVDREHIRYLVSAGLAWDHISNGHLQWYWRSGWHKLEGENASRVGQMLWDENIRSIEGRYPDCVGHEERMPGAVGENYLFDFERWPLGQIQPVQVFKACACYSYQSCEHEEWEASEAFAYIQALRKRAEGALPGYEDAEWGVPTEQVTA